MKIGVVGEQGSLLSIIQNSAAWSRNCDWPQRQRLSIHTGDMPATHQLQELVQTFFQRYNLTSDNLTSLGNFLFN